KWAEFIQLFGPFQHNQLWELLRNSLANRLESSRLLFRVSSRHKLRFFAIRYGAAEIMPTDKDWSRNSPSAWSVCEHFSTDKPGSQPRARRRLAGIEPKGDSLVRR